MRESRERVDVRAIGVVALASLVGSYAHADIIASQDFNGLSDASTETFDSVADGEELDSAGSKNPGNGGMEFSTFWFDTYGVAGGVGPVTQANDTSDFIGVNSFAGVNAPDVAPDGTAVASGTEHNFEFNDGDGRLALVFAAIDVSDYENVMLDFSYWINDTTYETGDAFDAWIGDGNSSVSILEILGVSGGPRGDTEDEDTLEGSSAADDGTANWTTLSVDISALIADNGLGDMITLTIGVTNNSGSENMFVDDVAFTGDLIPVPGTLALLGIAGVVGARRRRRVA